MTIGIFGEDDWKVLNNNIVVTHEDDGEIYYMRYTWEQNNLNAYNLNRKNLSYTGKSIQDYTYNLKKYKVSFIFTLLYAIKNGKFDMIVNHLLKFFENIGKENLSNYERFFCFLFE